ncbi:MAG TPA: type II secretion system F family protein, partial [Chloroflexota bacterium]|nr:type II secretion system F family protein [Chloroflexota bacterium]
LLIGVAAFGAVALIALVLFARSRESVSQRLSTYGGRSTSKLDPTLPFSARVIAPMVSGIANLVLSVSKSQIERDVRAKLSSAGNPSGLDVNKFLALRGLGLVAPVLLFALPRILSGTLDLKGMAITIVLCGVGWKAPGFWLDGRISARRKVVTAALPDALDLIIVCVEAGNGLDSALTMVAARLSGPLAEEIDRMLREIGLGKARHDAMHDMSDRVGAPDLQSFIAAIVQADQLGVSIGQVLRVQGEAMRIRRSQRAEEAAAQAPVKMLVPMVLFILPSLFIIIMGPVVLGLMKSFSPAGPGP